MDSNTNPPEPRVMNDDVLILIFKNMSIKDLIQLETTSHQFSDCIERTLRLYKTELSVGDSSRKDSDITKAIVRRETLLTINDRIMTILLSYDLSASLLMLQSLTAKCPRIKSLYLKYAIIDYPTIALIVNSCLQLTRLSLINTEIKEFNATTGQQWTQLLGSRLTYLCLTGEPLNTSQQMMAILRQFTALQQFCGHFKDISDEQDIQIFANIPIQIQCLELKLNCLSQQDLDSISPFITQIGPHLQSLEMSFKDLLIDTDQYLLTICDECKVLKKLKFKGWVGSHIDIAFNISKLQQLKNLDFTSSAYFNVNDIKPMPSLTQVSLKECKFHSTQWTQVTTIWSNVGRISLNHCHIDCECDYQNPCQCVGQYFQCLSYIPHIAHFGLKRMNFNINGQHLNSFIELKTLSIDWDVMSSVDQLLFFCMYCAANRVNQTPLKLIINEESWMDVLNNQFTELGIHSQSIQLIHRQDIY